MQVWLVMEVGFVFDDRLVVEIRLMIDDGFVMQVRLMMKLGFVAEIRTVFGDAEFLFPVPEDPKSLLAFGENAQGFLASGQRSQQLFVVLASFAGLLVMFHSSKVPVVKAHR
jgi:hypothetical protein